MLGRLIIDVKSNMSNPTARIDSLLIELDKANKTIDSLQFENARSTLVIDSTKTKIKYINRVYEKDINTYLSQPSDSDAVQFAKYLLSENPGGLFSSYNSTTIKGY